LVDLYFFRVSPHWTMKQIIYHTFEKDHKLFTVRLISTVRKVASKSLWSTQNMVTLDNNKSLMTMINGNNQ